MSAQQSCRDVVASLDIGDFDYVTETVLAITRYHGDLMILKLLCNPIAPSPSFKVEVGGYKVHHSSKLEEAIKFYNDALVADPPVRSILADEG